MKQAFPAELRPGAARGRLQTDWLQARLSFSFGSWRDPRRDHFGALRALNEDLVAPASGFAMHPHRQLDILLLPWTGPIEHADSLGHRAVVRPGEVQAMLVGDGLSHSQMNASAQAPERHFQLWFDPPLSRGHPQLLQRRLPAPAPDGWQAVIGPAGTAAPIDLGHDLRLWIGRPRPADALPLPGRADARLYLHAIDGPVTIETMDEVQGRCWSLDDGDALAFDHGFPRLALRLAPAAALLRIEQGIAAPASPRDSG